MEELSWEDIATNITRLKAINERVKDEGPPHNEYFDTLLIVNQAIQRGAQLSIRVKVATHSFMTPRHEAHSLHTFSQQEGCVLVLHKVEVTFQPGGTTDEQATPSTEYIVNIFLLWRDITHACDQIWGAIFPQPQWEDIVQQAQTFLREHPVLSEGKEKRANDDKPTHESLEKRTPRGNKD